MANKKNNTNTKNSSNVKKNNKGQSNVKKNMKKNTLKNDIVENKVIEKNHKKNTLKNNDIEKKTVEKKDNISKEKSKFSFREMDEKTFRIICVVGLSIIVFCLFYLLTLYITKSNSDSSSTSNTTEEKEDDVISYTNILAGRSFSMEDGTYLVIYYDMSDDEIASTYSSAVSSYRTKEGASSLYVVDMGNGLNKKYASEESNSNPSSASELAINGPTLIRFEDHHVVEYFEGEEAITSYLE